jgi:hypothetical protein
VIGIEIVQTVGLGKKAANITALPIQEFLFDSKNLLVADQLFL